MRSAAVVVIAGTLLLGGCNAGDGPEPEPVPTSNGFTSPVPAFRYTQAQIDGMVDYFADHAGDCRAAFRDATSSTRVNHAQLREALAAQALIDPPPTATQLPSGHVHLFLGKQGAAWPALDASWYRYFGAGVTPAQRSIAAADVSAWQAAAHGANIESYHVAFSVRYAGDVGKLHAAFVRSSGGTPTEWPEVHEAWAKNRYGSGAWTLFVPDEGMHAMYGRPPKTPAAGMDDAQREIWLNTQTAFGVEMVKMPQGELPLVHLECNYAMREE